MFGHENHVFNANSEFVGDINGWFNRDDHPGFKDCRIIVRDARRFMDIQANPMPQGMTEKFG